jgi:ABC-type sugar transport system permease subunit
MDPRTRRIRAAGSADAALVPFPRRDIVLFVAPATVLVAGLYIAPLVMNSVLSLFRWTAFRSDLQWAGLENYQTLDDLGLLVPAVQRTLVYAVVAATVMVVGPLALALALERGTRTNKALRTLFIIPVLLSPLAVGFVFRAILGLEGVVNELLSTIAPGPVRIPWLASRDLSIFVVAVAVAWRFAPVIFIVFLAGLAAMPPEVIDAGRIDGAGRWALFRHVKLPLLAPAVTFAVVTITALSVYETVFVLTGGGPGRSTEVLNFLVIDQFGRGRWGSAAALSTVLYGVIFLLVVPLVAALRRREVQL